MQWFLQQQQQQQQKQTACPQTTEPRLPPQFGFVPEQQHQFTETPLFNIWAVRAAGTTAPLMLHSLAAHLLPPSLSPSLPFALSLTLQCKHSSTWGDRVDSLMSPDDILSTVCLTTQEEAKGREANRCRSRDWDWARVKNEVRGDQQKLTKTDRKEIGSNPFVCVSWMNTGQHTGFTTQWIANIPPRETRPGRARRAQQLAPPCGARARTGRCATGGRWRWRRGWWLEGRECSAGHLISSGT